MMGSYHVGRDDARGMEGPYMLYLKVTNEMSSSSPEKSLLVKSNHFPGLLGLDVSAKA